MGSQLWSYVNVYVIYLVYTIFLPQKNSCFSFQKCLGINANELQFYMKYLMFCLKQHSLKKNQCSNIFHLSV